MAKNKEIIISLQGLRGIAICLIILSHCNYIRNDYGNNIFTWAGALGVSIFIILSGFLAVYHNHKEAAYQSLPSTFILKVKKFYPLHFITLLLAIPLYFHELFTETGKTILKLLSNLFLVQAWIPKKEFYFSFNAVSWYLSITLFFVLIMPLTMKLLKSLRSIQIIILVMIIVFIQVLLVYITKDKEIAHWLVYVCPLVRSLDFICGEGLAFILLNQKNKTRVSTLGNNVVLISTLTILVVILMTSVNTKNEIYSAVCWTLLVLFLIGCLLGGQNQSKLIKTCFNNEVVVFVGNISFNLFLIHQLVIQYMSKIFNKLNLGNSIWQYIVAIAITTVTAIFLNKMKTKESTL